MKYAWTAERDQVLRERYDPRARGAIAQLAGEFGWPPWVLKKRAGALGLSREAHPKAWRAEEIAFLREHMGPRSTWWIAKQLERSQASVVLKIKRLGISRRAAREGYTLGELQLAFGTDHHVIERWVREGRLRVARRETRRQGKQGDIWLALDSDILSFIRTHRAAFRLDKVDQEWFLNLIFGGPVVHNHARLSLAAVGP